MTQEEKRAQIIAAQAEREAANPAPPPKPPVKRGASLSRGFAKRARNTDSK